MKSQIRKAYKNGNRTFAGLVKFIQVNFPNTHSEKDFELVTEVISEQTNK